MIAVVPTATPDTSQPATARDPKPTAGADFLGELKTAQKKPATKVELVKKATPKPGLPTGTPAPQALLDPQPALAALAAPADPSALTAPVASGPQLVADVVALISAGKSLVTPAAGKTAAVGAQVADVAVDEAPALQAANAVPNPSDALPLTPLEQAVHDVLERLRDDSDKASDRDDRDGREPHQSLPLPGVISMSATIEDAPIKKPEGPQPLREPTPAEQLQNANPSHIHLVIDDGERLVVTVAVRGDQVMTHLRGDNQETANAFARNAGVLDEAMRARGLNLAELHTSHEQSPGQRQQKHTPPQERERAQPRFNLEENL